MPDTVTGLLRTPGAMAVALCALVFAALFPALFGGFVWDDAVLGYSRTLREWSGLWRIWFEPGNIASEHHYWPVTYTSFWLEDKLWGLNAFSSHLVNILLHLANTLLLWQLLTRLAIPGAWLAAALFAVHPVHVEVAAWVIARKDLLATLFSLGCALVWLRFSPDDKAQPGLRHGAAVALLLIAALLSKSVAVTLPCTLLLLYWLQHGHLPRRVVLWATPLFLITAVITTFDLHFYRMQDPPSYDYSLVERVLIAAQALCFYAGKLLWPTNLTVIYPHWEPVSARGWLCLVVVIGVFALLGCLRRRLGHGPLTGVLFFVLTLLPVLGFVDFNHMTFSFVADRYQYLASAGLLAVAAGGTVRLARTLPRLSRRSLQLAVALGLGVLSWMSGQQVGIYRDPVHFYSHILTHNPQAHGMHANFSVALYHRGRMQEALEAGRVALEQEPDARHAPYTRHRAGVILAGLGQYAEAREQLRRALETDRDDIAADSQTQAEEAMEQGHYDRAIVFLQVLTEVRPQRASAWATLGEALGGAGRNEEAITALQQAIALAPYDPAIPTMHVLLAYSAEALGQGDRAQEHYRKALQRDANFLPAMVALAKLRFAQKHYPEALALLRRLTELAPDNALAHARLGATLAELGQIEDARDSLQRSLALDPKQTDARDWLRHLQDPR